MGSGSEKVWAAIARDQIDAPVSPSQMLRDLYGSNSRGGVNTKAAATATGKSERTIRRWAKNGLPANTEAQQVRAQHQQWKTSPQGRKANLNSRRESRLRSKGTTVNFVGKIKISNDRRGTRSTSVVLTGPQMDAILDAGLTGDDNAARRALEDAFGGMFGGSLDLEIESLETYK